MLINLFICRNCDLVQLGKNAPVKNVGDTYGCQSSICKIND